MAHRPFGRQASTIRAWCRLCSFGRRCLGAPGRGSTSPSAPCRARTTGSVCLACRPITAAVIGTAITAAGRMA